MPLGSLQTGTAGRSSTSIPRPNCLEFANGGQRRRGRRVSSQTLPLSGLGVHGLLPLMLNIVIGNGSIVEAGCGPIQGTEDPCKGMQGPVCVFWFKIALALAGASPAQEWVVYVHQTGDGRS